MLNVSVLCLRFIYSLASPGGIVQSVPFPLFIGSLQRLCPLLDGGLLGSDQPVGVDDKLLMFL